MIYRFLLLVLAGGLLWLGTRGVGAQTAVPPPNVPAALPVVANEAIIDFPQSVTFRLAIAPELAVETAVLHYGVDRFSCVDLATELPVTVTDNVAEWQWVMIRSGNPPPGASVSWQWTVTGAGGRQYTTPLQTVTLADGRFSWQTVREGRMTLHWYEGAAVGPTLLEAAVAGLDRLESEMGIELVDDVQIWIYGSAADMRQAVLYIQDWAGGVAFSDYNTILIGVPPRLADDWGRSTVRHELAHLVVGQFARSCVAGSRPTWLDEGLAVVAEGAPSPATLADIAGGIADDSFQPLRSLNGAFPAHSQTAGIAYSQSYSVVAYLLDEYGQAQMQELLLMLAGGVGIDQALEQVYGFNVDGLEIAWREAIGAPPRPIPPTPTPLSAAAVPTVAPFRPQASVPTPAAAAAPPPVPESDGITICGLGWLPLLLLAATGGAQLRRRRSAPGRDRP